MWQYVRCQQLFNVYMQRINSIFITFHMVSYDQPWRSEKKLEDYFHVKQAKIIQTYWRYEYQTSRTVIDNDFVFIFEHFKKYLQCPLTMKLLSEKVHILTRSLALPIGKTFVRLWCIAKSKVISENHIYITVIKTIIFINHVFFTYVWHVWLNNTYCIHCFTQILYTLLS